MAGRSPLAAIKVVEFGKTDLPFERITGISVVGPKWVVGSMRGLYVGKPRADWKQVSTRSVRQVATKGTNTWVLYGDGSVDKLDVGSDRLYYDVFQGAVKRPWVSSISEGPRVVLFGSSGGWFERSGKKPLKECYPPVVTGKEVTSMLIAESETLVGTQDGLFSLSAKNSKRFGFGSGLADTWITSMTFANSTSVVGTYTGGIYQYANGEIHPEAAPSKKVVKLTTWKGNLVLGGMDGAWLRTGNSWQPLTTGETTFLQVLGENLFVGTPSSVTEFN